MEIKATWPNGNVIIQLAERENMEWDVGIMPYIEYPKMKSVGQVHDALYLVIVSVASIPSYWVWQTLGLRLKIGLWIRRASESICRE
jgi:hypothetical protein